MMNINMSSLNNYFIHKLLYVYIERESHYRAHIWDHNSHALLSQLE